MVLCITSTSLPQVKLITGAEGGEVTSWSGDNAVISKFSVSNADDDVTSIVCSSLKPDLFYVSAGCLVHCYDLRQLGTGAVNTFSFCEDEISEISLNEKESYLAIADDTGHIKVINTTDGKLFKILRKHTNICSAVRFRPHRQWDLLTGGYDSKLIQWDFSKPRAYCQIDMQEIGVTPENLDSYVVSPPFIHSIGVSSSGNTVAVGTENALVQVFDGSRRSLAFQKTLRYHTQGVCQVHLPSFTQDQCIVSGGNDGHICIWNLEDDSGSDVVPLTNGNGCSSEGSPTSLGDSGIQPKHVIQHSHKINWITSSRTANSKFLAVADSTNQPVLFQFPE